MDKRKPKYKVGDKIKIPRSVIDSLKDYPGELLESKGYRVCGVVDDDQYGYYITLPRVSVKGLGEVGFDLFVWESDLVVDVQKAA